MLFHLTTKALISIYPISALRRLLSPSNHPRDTVIASERDLISRKLDLLERENRSLREKVG